MTDHENTHVVKPPSGKASGASKAFPENVESQGRKHFGPAPSPHQPAQENVFNTDKHGKRVPRDT